MTILDNTGPFPIACTHQRHAETASYMLQPAQVIRHMPIEIEGVQYFTAADIHRDLGIVRQTLWRWRKAWKIPRGRRYRDRQVVFTKQEVEAIREYANRLEPAEPSDANQLTPFNAGSPNRSV